MFRGIFERVNVKSQFCSVNAISFLYNKLINTEKSDHMILYFSGTGNSEYVAKKIAAYISDEVVNLFDKLRLQDYETMTSEKPWVIVAPTYAWQLPHIVRDWLLKTNLEGNKKIYFVLTCGDSIGNAGVYAEKLCQKKQMIYMGTAKIVMPENYIAMFNAPNKKQTVKIIKKAQAHIKVTADIIQAEVFNEIHKPSAMGKLMSGLVNFVFYRFCISAKNFYATEHCISCGKCATVCPYDNIKMVDRKPDWGNECTHCMACICKCPKEAIEYGKKSKGKIRYQFPKK